MHDGLPKVRPFVHWERLEAREIHGVDRSLRYQRQCEIASLDARFSSPEERLLQDLTHAFLIGFPCANQEHVECIYI